MRRIAFFLSLVVLAFQARAADDVPPHDSFTMPGVTAAETRHINVYTPPGYATSNARYPVLYMPDGGLEEDFPHVAKALDEGIREGEIQPLILVGIENIERRRDMTGPTSVASDRQIAPHVGGSSAFRAFIATGLVPEVSKRYRVDAHRGIIGESLAGLFALETLQRQPKLFDTVIAISPSVWWNDGALVRDLPVAMAKGDQSVHRIYLTSADEENIAPGVEQLVSALRRTLPSSVATIEYVPRPLAHHDTIYRESEAQALRWAYPPAASIAVRKLLFIGNSLTYVNDLPGAVASLAPRGSQISVDMIARGGASLADAAQDPVVAKALAVGGYTDVILQERGGDAFCPAACQRHAGFVLPAQVAAGRVAAMARTAGARVFYLGTWQTSRDTDEALEYGERHIASAIHAPYVEVALPRRRLMEAQPSLAWVHPDGQHPGYTTTAFMALRVWRTVIGTAPAAVPCVAGEVHYHAPMPDGVFHEDMSLTPWTCLVSATEAAMLNDNE